MACCQVAFDRPVSSPSPNRGRRSNVYLQPSGTDRLTAGQGRRLGLIPAGGGGTMGTDWPLRGRDADSG